MQKLASKHLQKLRANRQRIDGREGPHPGLDWKANSGPQADFVHRTEYEIMYGGAVGGGKSEALLVDAVRYVGCGYGGDYRGIILRRTMPELEGTLIPRSRELYPKIGGVYNISKSFWRFPAGERIYFGHIDHEAHVYRYSGWEFQFIAFDELTTFTETQYLFLVGSRCRSAHGVPLRVRSGTNPGATGHEWVFKRWGAWLDPKVETTAKSGETLHYISKGDKDTVATADTPLARSRCFIRSLLKDTPQLAGNRQYEANLQLLDPVTRKQLLEGDWLVRPGKGLYFKRAWWKFIDADAVPTDGWTARYWDRAATEPEKGKDPDWTVGTKARLTEDGKLYVLDVVRERGTPGEVEKIIKNTAEADGKDVAIGLEQEPGASGKAEIASYVRLLNGWDVRPFAKRVNKIVAAGPVSAQVQAGNVYLVRAPWNEPLIIEGEQFPEGSHDDQADSLSGVHTQLTGDMRTVRETVGIVIPIAPVDDWTVGSD